MDSKAAENGVLSINLMTVLAALSDARQKENEATDALSRRLDTQMDLIVEQGNNALQMKAELQRTRDKIFCCQRDADQMAAEKELLRSKIAELQSRSTPPSADAKFSKASVAQQARWCDSVFFLPSDESAMGGANVCPIPGKSHITANDGSAATLPTVSINGSSTNGSSSSSSSILIDAAVSPGSSVAALSPASPSESQADIKATSAKTKRGKLKQ